MGKTATFLVEGRQANLKFARTMMGFLGSEESGCAIFDLDALYSSNADSILAPLEGAAKSSLVTVPPPGSDIEEEFSRLFETKQRVLIVDSLNSLYHLISQEDGSSRSRRLTFASASLSYLARTNDKAVILTMYRREGFTRPGTGRSISTHSDVTASVEVREGEIVVRSERGAAWPGGRFSSRIP
jgi:hypothetical protein